jgi:hypothetical protein
MLAEVLQNERDLADALFLVAAILAVLAAVLGLVDRTTGNRIALGWLAVAALAVGWLAL